MRRRGLPVALVVSFSLIACGEDSAQTAGDDTGASPDTGADVGADATEGSGDPTYYAQIKPVLDAYCVRCHGPEGPAPFEMTTYEAVAPLASRIAEVTESRLMPPFLAAPAVRPLAHDASLSEAQIALFRQWADAGALAGDPATEGAPITLELGRLSRVDLTIEMPEPYTPITLPDEYRCFVIDWPLDHRAFITGLNVRPGNLSVAHHAIAYLVDPAYVALVDEADGADGRPGYDCFGGATPPGVESFPTKIVAGWAPGEQGQDFPDGTGVRVEPGSRVIIQMHYSILAEGPQPDVSAIDLRIEDEVETNAGNLPWLNLEWTTNSDLMGIPAGESHVTHEYVADPTEAPLLFEFVPGVNPSEGLYMHSMLPHLHKLGTAIRLQLERADGSIEELVRIDRWDFDWQGYYTFEEPVLVLPGDQLRIHCEWDNSAENQPVIQGVRREPADIGWGEGTYDEMCAASIYVSGVAQGTPACDAVGSIPAEAGNFVISFDAAANIRTSPSLDGELRGTIYGSVYASDDVILTGPVEGAVAVASFRFDDVDLREGADGPWFLDAPLPAGDYQFLGFMDIDNNANPESPDPDVNDPVLLPGGGARLQCLEQPLTARFAMLLPDL